MINGQKPDPQVLTIPPLDLDGPPVELLCFTETRPVDNEANPDRLGLAEFLEKSLTAFEIWRVVRAHSAQHSSEPGGVARESFQTGPEFLLVLAKQSLERSDSELADQLLVGLRRRMQLIDDGIERGIRGDSAKHHLHEHVATTPLHGAQGT